MGVQNTTFNDFYYYTGDSNRQLNFLRKNYGLILCIKDYARNYSTNQLKYYDENKNDYVYKSDRIRRNIIVTYYYYDFNNKTINILNIKSLNKKLSYKYFNENFDRANKIKNIDSLSRVLKLQKIMDKIKI